MKSIGLVILALAMQVMVDSVFAQTPTPMNFHDYWSTLSEEKRAAVVRGSVQEETYFPNLDYCRYLEDYAGLSFYFSVAPEPFGADCLTTLAALLPTLSHEEGRRAAAVLYRYDAASGRTHLVQALQGRSDSTAATILAVNRESEVLDGILRAYRLAREKPSALTAALMTWDSPAASAALLEELRKNPANSDLMIASAVARTNDAVPILEAQHQEAPPNDIRRLAAAAALAALDIDRSTHVQSLLEQLSIPGPSDTWRNHVVGALSAAGGSDAAAALLSIVSEFTTTGSVHGVSGGVATDVAVRAAKGLGLQRTPSAFSAIHAVLQKLGPVRPGSGDRRHGELAWLLLEIDAVNGTSAIRAELGDAWLQRLLVVRALKRLPPGLVPRKSADVEVDEDVFWFI